MGVLKKHRRKITVNGEKFLWYIGTAGDHWERAEPNDGETVFLHILSEDKSLVLTIPIDAPKPYAVSEGRTFQGKQRSGCWGRYYLPFTLPKIITPKTVAEIIEWAVRDGSDIPHDYGGDLKY